MGNLSALNAAASGLRGYNMKFDAHSQNLAAAGAIGGKKRFTYLSSVNSDNSTNYFTPGGIQGKPMINIAKAGNRINVDNPLHMALTGESFFVVNTSASNTDPGDYAFTRTGSFSKDKDNNVVNHLGQYLKYFPYDLTTGTFPAGSNTTTLEATKTLNLAGFSGMPQATSSITLANSLPGSLAPGAVQTQSIVVHDSLGGSHTLNFTWTKTAQAAPGQTWTLAISSPEAGVTIAAPYVAGAPIVFDGQGVPLTFNGNPTIDNIVITWGNGASNSTIALDLGTAGASNGVTAGGGNNFFLNSLSVDGYSAGRLKDVAIDKNGEVSITFDNGAPAQKIGRIPVATFASVNSLLEGDGNSYTATGESGNYLLQFLGTGGKAGDVLSSHLEESTVDSADTFAEMITDSKRYTANLKTISTIDKMLDALERAVM